MREKQVKKTVTRCTIVVNPFNSDTQLIHMEKTEVRKQIVNIIQRIN